MTIVKPKSEAKVPMSFQITQYIKNNPTAKAADVAKALGTTPGYVYTITHSMKRKAAKKQKITKEVIAKRMELAKAEGEKKQQWPYAEEAKRIYELTKGRQRMHPVTGKMLMQGGVTAQMMKDTVTFMQNEKADNVNHPAHYKVGGMETIDFIEAKGLGYNLGNVVKYITRADHKGNLVEDLKKARWYLNREISKLDGAEN